MCSELPRNPQWLPNLTERTTKREKEQQSQQRMRNQGPCTAIRVPDLDRQRRGHLLLQLIV